MLSIPWATTVAFAGLALMPALALPPSAVSLARLAGWSLLPVLSDSTDSAATFSVMTAGGTHVR